VNDDNKRNYSRINTALPFQARQITSDNRDELKCRVSRGDMVLDNSIPPEIEDESLNMWLNMINAKLDYLISRDPPQNEDSLFMTFEPLNVSGSGMMIKTTEEFQKGDILEIKMVLQSYPPKVLYLYGEVVRIEGNPLYPGVKNVGLNFLNINEEVRNEIIRFDFKKHRERLKKKVEGKRRGG
jgi:hypothetical protein